MNKEKFSKILNQYSEHLKKYGIYLLIILFVLTLSFNYFLGQLKNVKVETSPDLQPPLDVAIEKNDPTIKADKSETGSPESVPSKKVEPAASPVVVKQSENNIIESKPTESEPNPTKENNEETRPLAHSPTGPLTLDWPNRGEVLKGYGLSYFEVYKDYRLYPGIDISTEKGKNVTTAYEGKVSLIEKAAEGTFIVEVDHGQGWLTHYAHLTQVFIKEGQNVKKGEKVGQADTYLHFRLKQDGYWVDPLKFLEK